MATIPTDQLVDKRSAFAAILATAFSGHPKVTVATGLLAAHAIDPEAVELDSHLRLVAFYVEAIDRCLSELERRDWVALQGAATENPVRLAKPLPRNGLADALALWLSRVLAPTPDRAAALAVATGRLFEEASVLNPVARRLYPLGRGFESPLRDRLERRVALLQRDPALVDVVDRHLQPVMEDPSAGLRLVSDEVGRVLTRDELTWLAAERHAGLLWAARHDKVEFGGHIRWFLRRDVHHGVVLDRYGMRGRWIVAGTGGPQALLRAGDAAARSLGEPPLFLCQTGWHAVWHGDLPESIDATNDLVLELRQAHVLLPSASPEHDERELTPLDSGDARRLIANAAKAATPIAPTDGGPKYHLVATETGIALLPEVEGEPIAQVASEAPDEDLIDFVDAVRRVSEHGPVIDAMGERWADADPVLWTRAILASGHPAARTSADAINLTDISARLVYVPASREHPLGGLPMIGLQFLKDRLEAAGARADVVSMASADFDRRLAELLGADVIGLSVYLTNRREVATLVTMLREAGYAGRIILGGPELRDIDGVEHSVKGWDALIRGEAEEALIEVMRALRHFEFGETQEAVDIASGLDGVVIAHRDVVVMAHTAARNTVEEIRLPLPFDWARNQQDDHLQMNFTRGCPWKCGFCPNHQGRKYHTCSAEEMWRFTALAAADALLLPEAYERRCAEIVQTALGVSAPPRLRVALHLLFVGGTIDPGLLCDLRSQLATLIDDQLLEDPELVQDVLGVACAASGQAETEVAVHAAKRAWLETKLLIAGSAVQREDVKVDGPGTTTADVRFKRFELSTSEDNTLVNKRAIAEYLALRRKSGLTDVVTFNPGQNTVHELLDANSDTGLDLDYIAVITDDNPFRIVLGSDGTSNPVLRANNKPTYGVEDVVAVNRALTRRGAFVLNNYILLNPEVDLLEAVEAMMLFVMLPISWRDHGKSINLRITREAGTQSHDEGLLLAPEQYALPDEDPDDFPYDDPFRYPEVEDLLHRWNLTAFVHSADLEPLLWRILEEDEVAAPLVPKVIRRWERDFDNDAVLTMLASVVGDRRAGGATVLDACRSAADWYSKAWLELDERRVRPTAPRTYDLDLSGITSRRRRRKVEGRRDQQAQRGVADHAPAPHNDESG